ncbi:hypothetical protein [Flammeovirga aprica]|uniref:TonB-dependent receptor plug domain-containing protein n=1 Tax=Flammeovirga aprica JL-4 TaxID=694437 RepID=A0A7X9RYH2_9BACT|nr:hypothetical protein [Flammeovirga aprica]NME71070.1 hypothetical protein [Flammeovirga aprica JL-4]
MRKILHIMTLLILWINLSFGQSLDKKYIDSWVLNTVPNSMTGKNVLYIIEGIPLNNDSLNYELSKFKRSDIISIHYIGKAYANSLTFCRPLEGIIIIIPKGGQSKRSIRETFSQAKAMYPKPDLKTTADIDPEKGEPVLIIDGVQIDHRKYFDRFNEIKLKKIIGIQYIDNPVNPEIFGANSVNGLVKITTK